MSIDNSPQLEINHHPRCTCTRNLALQTTLLSVLRARTHHLPRAHLYVSILLVKQARHAVRVDTWLCEIDDVNPCMFTTYQDARQVRLLIFKQIFYKYHPLMSTLPDRCSAKLKNDYLRGALNWRSPPYQTVITN